MQLIVHLADRIPVSQSVSLPANPAAPDLWSPAKTASSESGQQWEVWPECCLPPATFLWLTWSYDRDTMACLPASLRQTHVHSPRHMVFRYICSGAVKAPTPARSNAYQCALVVAWIHREVNLKAHECVWVHTPNTCELFLRFPIFRKSAGASHCFGPQRMSSYCGFGAPKQLGEFMVSAKKQRSLSFCQSWFPLRFKGPTSPGCQGWTQLKAVGFRRRVFFFAVISFLLPLTGLCC